MAKLIMPVYIMHDYHKVKQNCKNKELIIDQKTLKYEPTKCFCLIML